MRILIAIASCLIFATGLFPGSETLVVKSVYVQDGLRVRQRPTTESPSLRVLPYGTKVSYTIDPSDRQETILGIEGHWRRLQAEKGTADQGWIFDGFLSSLPLAPLPYNGLEHYVKTWASAPPRKKIYRWQKDPLPAIETDLAETPPYGSPDSDYYFERTATELNSGLLFEEDLYLESGGTALYSKNSAQEMFLLARLCLPLLKGPYRSDQVIQCGPQKVCKGYEERIELTGEYMVITIAESTARKGFQSYISIYYGY